MLCSLPAPSSKLSEKGCVLSQCPDKQASSLFAFRLQNELRAAHSEALTEAHTALAAAQAATAAAEARAAENAEEAELASGAATALEERVGELEAALSAGFAALLICYVRPGCGSHCYISLPSKRGSRSLPSSGAAAELRSRCTGGSIRL